jgi:hypothetical protein
VAEFPHSSNGLNDSTQISYFNVHLRSSAVHFSY